MYERGYIVNGDKYRINVSITANVMEEEEVWDGSNV